MKKVQAMNKVLEQTPKYKNTTPHYKALADYFEPLVGYSQINRHGYRYLITNGFFLEHWSLLCEKMDISNKPFDSIVKSITKKESSSACRAFLLYLAVELTPERLYAYLLKQVKIHATTDFLGAAFLIRLGEKGNFNQSYIWQGKDHNHKSSMFIKKLIEIYWENEDSSFKARHNYYCYLKYRNTICKFSTSGVNDKALKIINNFNRLKALVIDIAESTNDIKVIQNNHGAVGQFFIKLFEHYSPAKVLNELEEKLDWMIRENIPILSIHQAYYKVFFTLNEKKAQTPARLSKSSLKREYDKLAETKIKEQIILLKSSNLNKLRERKESFSLIYLDKNLVKSLGCNVSFHTLPLFDEWAEYVLSCGNNIRKLGYLNGLINYIAERRNDVKTLCAHNIIKKDITSYLDSGTASQTGSRRAMEAFRSMIKFLKDRETRNKLPLMGILPKAPLNDVSNGISVKKPDENNRQPIPDSVFDQIMLHIDELEPIYKNAFILSAAGGLRTNEWEGITADSLVEEGSKQILEVWQYKVEKACMKKSKKPIRHIPLHDENAIHAFREQVKESTEARKKSGVASIFIKKKTVGNAYGILNTHQLTDVINKLIKRHNICDALSEELWHYTPYQLRVSLVVEMIESGASGKQIRAFFGWLADETMKNAYYMARKLRLMDMNTDFFKKEFSINLSQNAIDQYAEEELREIVVMFYATSREMMYGRCMRHPSQGICGKLHEASACAPCHNLKAAPKYRKQWEELYNNQYSQLKRLRLFYEQRGHQPEQFEKYEFYIVQSGILNSYFSVLLNIDK